MLRRILVSILFVSAITLAATACSALNVAQASKPAIVIASPPSGSQFAEGDDVTVQSIATDSTGIVRVELVVDGATVTTDSPPVAQGQSSFSVAQKWKAMQGTHTIIVRAVNVGGTVSNPAGISISVLPASAPAPNLVPTLPALTPTFTPESPTLTPIPPATSTEVPPTITATPCAQPQIASFTINPVEIKRGDTATLNWGAVTNANAAVIDNGIGGVPAPGSRQVRPDKNTTFTLSATGCGGAVTAQASVNVFANGPPDPGIPQGRQDRTNPFTLNWNRKSNFLYGIEVDTDRSGSFQRFDTKENIDDDHYDVKNLPGGEYRLRFRVWQIDRNTKQRVSLKGKYSVICFPDNGKPCPQP